MLRQQDSLGTADQIASVVSMLVALITVILLLTDRHTTPVGGDALTAAADALAERTLAQWLPEAAIHQLDPADPIPVTWRWDAKRSRSRADFPAGARPPDHGVVTQLYEQVYDALPRSTLLVLLGEKGTGKSATMLLLLIRALSDRAANAGSGPPNRPPVPLWITVGGWDPAARPLRQLAAEALVWMLPALGDDRNFGPEAAQRLIDCGAVALFLDGLDEMPRDLRIRAVAAAAKEVRAGLRVVITSRPDGYERPRLPGSRLPAPVVVRLQPLDASTVADHITRGHTGDEATAWTQVGTHLLDHPDGVMAAALDTPLFVSLALAAYSSPSPGHHDPRELLDVRSAEAIRTEVVDLFLRRAYPDDGDDIVHQQSHRRATTGRPRRTGMALWRLRRDQWSGLRLLEWTAANLGENSDLRWWAVPAWVSADRLAGACWIVVAALGGCAALGTVLAGGPSHPTLKVTVVLAGACLGGLFGLLAFNRFMASRTGPAHLHIRWPERNEARYLLSQGFTFGLPFALAIGFARGPAPGVITGAGFFLFGLFGGNLGPTDRGLLAVWSRPLIGSPTMTPVASYRADLIRTAIIVTVTTTGVAAFLILLGQFEDDTAFGVQVGPGLGLLLGLWLSTGPALVLLLVPLAARRTGAGRRSILFLLRQAHERKVVRQAGMVYQFRHRELQIHLARRYHERLAIGARPLPATNPAAQ